MHRQVLFLVSIVLLTLINVKARTDIYGFRWFLGPQFSFALPEQSQQKNGPKYIFAFNSQQQIHIPLFLQMGKYTYTCSSRHIQIESNLKGTQQQYGQTLQQGSFETYINFCYVDHNFEQPQNYSIKAMETKYQTKDNITQMTGREAITYFSGVFRPITDSGNYQFLSLGDWGKITQKAQSEKGYIPTLPCMLQRVKTDDQIVGILFFGDLGYDMQGNIYMQMLKYIEPLTSQMVWIGVPGNHDTGYHNDAFMLVTQSFRTPQWNKYHNYLFSAQIGKDVLIVGYNPQKQVMGSTRMIEDVDLPSNFKKQFSQERLKHIAQNKTVIIMSHYPLFASNPKNTNQRSTLVSIYRTFFESMGLDLYISGHLHIYERLHPICLQNVSQSGSIDSFGHEFLGKCPVFIVQGAAGNSYYVQTEQQYTLTPQSASMVFNTGFGILTINRTANGETKQFKYQHYIAKNCSVADSFQIPVTILANQNSIEPIVKVLSIVVLIVGGLAVFAILAFLLFKARNIRASQTNQVVMVQQEFQSNSQKQKKAVSTSD